MSRKLQDKLMLVPDGLDIVSDTAFPASKELVGKNCSPLKDRELKKAHSDVQGLFFLVYVKLVSVVWVKLKNHSDNYLYHFHTIQWFVRLG